MWDAVDPTGSPLSVFAQTLPARGARFGTLTRPLPAEIAIRMDGLSLWSHQASAIDLARSGRSVVVATGTASGKSLCYQVPLAEAAANPVRSATSLLLFPTKALAHDQLRALTEWEFPGVVAGAYDGDAGSEERAFIRRKATTVLTNPEMLHSGLLPHHDRWATFLGRLRYVVIDELHVFRGIFGSHLAHVVRRLRRLARHYGAEPTFVCCSATIGEPGRLASAICGVPMEEVIDDGSPRGEKLVAIWNPTAERHSSPGKSRGPGVLRSSHDTTAALMSDLVAAGHRTLAFCRSRRVTELVAADVRRRLPAGMGERVKPYRGGYLADERRSVEEELFAGRLDGVVATNALELGVDLAGVDAVVLDGFPGTVASFWQQAGRSGRAQQPSAAVLVAGDDQLDQWFAAHPVELLTRSPEPAVVNPDNPCVADVHLRCAAHELPLSYADERYWPGLLDEVICRLAMEDDVVVRTRSRRLGPQAVYCGGGWPSHGVSLRVGSGCEISIRTRDGEAIGTVDRSRACEQVHPGAVYLHAGVTWQVTQLDLDERVAWVEPSDGATYTVARTSLDIRVLSCDKRRRIGTAGAQLEVGLGWVEVHQQVTGYQSKDVLTRRVLASDDLDLPPSTLRTRGFWYVVDDEVLGQAGVEPRSVGGALHAAEHAGIGVLPLFAICDRWDVGGVSTPHQPDLGHAAIVIYDGYEGGAGVAELGYEAADRHLATTLAVIAACGCSHGCPSCVQSPKCGNGNDPLDKAAAIALLRTVLPDST
ncbi:MAG TPA: DEAD/DEAH box helicase [Acidimicrobiales bacterium]|jgi:DEAD/DEAH box helicase domain-containing protein